MIKIMLKPWIQKFYHENRGVAAIEFAIIYPLFLVLLLALIDFGGALIKKRQVVQAAASLAQTAADISVKSSSSTYNDPFPSSITNVFQNGIKLTLHSNNATLYSARATKFIRINNAVVADKTWSTINAPNSIMTQTRYTAIMQNGEALYLSDIRFQYQYFFSNFLLKVTGASANLQAIYSASPYTTF